MKKKPPPPVRIFQKRVAALKDQFGREPTDEELCWRAKYEKDFHRTAWKLLNIRQASPDHFRAIAVASPRYREQSFAYVLSHRRHKDDVLFVASRKNNSTLKAAKTVVHYPLTKEELESVLSKLEGDDLFDVIFAIIQKYRHNVEALEMVIPDIYERYGVKLRERGVLHYLTGPEHLHQALRGRNRMQAGRMLLRDYSPQKSWPMIFDALRNEFTADFLDNIAVHCMTQRGIDWYKACAYLPKKSPIPMPFKECVEVLVALYDSRRALRILLLHSNKFRNYAVGTLLTHKDARQSDVRLMLQMGTYSMRYKAAMYLAGRKNVRLKLLVLAWQWGNKARSIIEQKILTYNNKRVREFLLKHTPDIYAELKKKYPKKFKT